THPTGSWRTKRLGLKAIANHEVVEVRAQFERSAIFRFGGMLCTPLRTSTKDELDVCHGPQLSQRAGQIASVVLLARCASIHVDFHAHRHFDNLRSFPGHSGLPTDLQVVWREVRAGVEPRATPDLAQVRNSGTERMCVRFDSKYFSLRQSYFSLGQ